MNTTTRGRYRKARNRKPLTIAAAFTAGLVLLIGACSDDTTVEVEPDPAPVVTESEPEAEPVVAEAEPEPQFDEPVAEDFELTVRTLAKKCYGSAGCNVTFQIDAGWLGDLDPDKTYEVTYEIEGGDDPLINTMEVVGQQYRVTTEERIGTPSSDTELIAVVTDVREQP